MHFRNKIRFQNINLFESTFRYVTRCTMDNNEVGESFCEVRLDKRSLTHQWHNDGVSVAIQHGSIAHGQNLDSGASVLWHLRSAVHLAPVVFIVDVPGERELVSATRRAPRCRGDARVNITPSGSTE